MKKWFFSNNGKVTAALDLEAAKEYLASNPDVYGWHPSFNQWKPVNCISEFVEVLPATVQAPLIPKEISDKFLAKKQRLESKLSSIDDSIDHSQSSLAKFAQQIAAYKSLTQNLNDDVKGAIDNIEKKYKNLNRKVSQVQDAVQIAETEMSEVVDDFDRRMSSNEIFMPSCNPSKIGQQEHSNSELSERAQASKAKLAQTKLATPHERVEPAEVKAEEVKVATKSEKAKVEKPTIEISDEAKIIKKNAAKKPSETHMYDTYDAGHAPSFEGISNMMKSVFKGDTNEDEDEANKEPLSMAERLKLAQANP